jgi:hypothetical protein
MPPHRFAAELPLSALSPLIPRDATACSAYRAPSA